MSRWATSIGPGCGSTTRRAPCSRTGSDCWAWAPRSGCDRPRLGGVADEREPERGGGPRHRRDRRARPRRRVRDAPMGGGRGGLPGSRHGVPRVVRGRFRAARRGRRRLLRRQGVPVHGGGAVGVRRGAQARHVQRGGARRRHPGQRSRCAHRSPRQQQVRWRDRVRPGLRSGTDRPRLDRGDRPGGRCRGGARDSRSRHAPHHDGRARGRPRVRRDSARGPEVRRVHRRRSGARRAPGHPRASGARAARYPLPHRLADPGRRSVRSDSATAALAAATGVLVPEVDLGGGYGISYRPGERGLPIGVAAQAIAEAVGTVCQELGTPVPRISIEPGRAIAGPSTFTLYGVGVVKPVTLEDGTVRMYVSVDGGMSDNPRPTMYGAEYTAVIANRVSRAAPVLCRVVGKHCESGDIVIRDIQLPSDIAPGDLLAVPGTGAYGRSMASNYNLVPRPPVVAVREHTSRVIVRRETVADLLALDVG